MSKFCFDLTAQVTVLWVEKPLSMSRQLTELCRYFYHNNSLAAAGGALAGGGAAMN